MDILISKANGKHIVDISNKEIAQEIRQKYRGKDILFLTDSNERYVSSWMNILRDDLGCIAFEPRKNTRKIMYIPKEMNDIERIEKIKTHTKSTVYVENFETIKNKLIKEVL